MFGGGQYNLGGFFQGSQTATNKPPSLGSMAPGSVIAGVPASRTSTAAETSYTITVISFPKSAKFRRLILSAVGAAFLVTITAVGQENKAMVAVPNVETQVDLTGYPDAISLSVSTEAQGVGTIAMVAEYQ